MIDLARNFAFSICIVAGLCTMLWGTAWLLMQAVDAWMRWRNVRKLLFRWLWERNAAKLAAQRVVKRETDVR
jgi:hypothetical protein